MAAQLPFVAARGGPAGPRTLPQRPCRTSRGALQCVAYQKTLPSVRRSTAANEIHRVKASLDGEALSTEALQSYYQEEQQEAAAAAISLPTPRRTASVLNAIVDTVAVTPYNWYCNSLRRHPLTTKACTSLVGFVLGDAIAQHITHPAFMDVVRTARVGMYGLLIDGPVGAAWYDALEAHLWPEDPTCIKAVIAKTALDQTLYATLMTAVYFSALRLMEGHPDAIMATLHAKFLPTLAANWVIWPVAHLVNFRFVPSEQRLLYNNVVCIFWLTLVSLMTHTNISHMLHK